MALVQCRECGREISDQAIACPQCGHPQRRAAPMSPLVKLVLGALVLILVGMFAIGIFLAWLAPRASYPIDVDMPPGSVSPTSLHSECSPHAVCARTQIAFS